VNELELLINFVPSNSHSFFEASVVLDDASGQKSTSISLFFSSDTFSSFALQFSTPFADSPKERIRMKTCSSCQATLLCLITGKRQRGRTRSRERVNRHWNFALDRHNACVDTLVPAIQNRRQQQRDRKQAEERTSERERERERESEREG
jgi:hypothetical protein